LRAVYSTTCRSESWPASTSRDIASGLCVSLLSTREATDIRQHALENDANRILLLVFTGIIMLVLFVAIAAESVGHNPSPRRRS
jgi:hypothetical protein